MRTKTIRSLLLYGRLPLRLSTDSRILNRGRRFQGGGALSLPISGSEASHPRLGPTRPAAPDLIHPGSRRFGRRHSRLIPLQLRRVNRVADQPDTLSMAPRQPDIVAPGQIVQHDDGDLRYRGIDDISNCAIDSLFGGIAKSVW